jgi:nitroimidazol reductase NimA-like FMN-containing flavoprotein (pyridoxamine 5'-phosphate oxidase superfamily)
MNEPMTELDTRFSDQDAVATDWEETRRVLENAELFWISTVRADGRPHVTPLVPVWLDDAIYFATGPGEQKAVNLRTNQNVILTTGCNEWERGLDAVVEGEAVQVVDESLLECLAETWATKWDGRWHYEVRDGGFRHEGGSGVVLVFSVKARQGARVRKRHLRPDAPPVLRTCAPRLTCRCSKAVQASPRLRESSRLSRGAQRLRAPR